MSAPAISLPAAARGRPRVLQIGKFYAPRQGGMERHLGDLCNGLHGTVDLKVLVANESRTTTRDVFEGVSVRRLATVCELAGASVCPEMVREIRDAKPELVHIHIPNPTAILAYLASGLPGRLVVTYHSDIVRQKVLGRMFDPIMRHVLKRAAAIIATSPAYIDTSPMLRRFRKQCRVIPLGVHLADFAHEDREAVDSIRAEHGHRLITTVGRLVYYKGFEYLIRAMREIDARLLIIGSGPLEDKLNREIAEHGLEDRVRLLGNVRDVAPYYYASELFVLPSTARSEAFGLVQLEAMACGRPVVNTDLPSGVPFVSLHGQTGLTVPPRNTGALVNAIQLLLHDEHLRRSYGDAARRRVQQEFDVSVMVRRTLDLYAEVMDIPQTALSA